MLANAARFCAAVLTAVALAVPASADEDINAWGKPDFEKGEGLGAAIWRDDDGWHIRWTTGGRRPHSFSGWIQTPDGEFTHVAQVHKERGDWARISPNEKRLVFDTRTDGGVDGFDFRSNSGHFTFMIKIDGEEHPGRVVIGANNRRPSKLPFVLTKWESHPRGGDRPGGPNVGGGPRPGLDIAAEDINAWGRPDFEKGDAAKIALWRDEEGWHVRWTTAGKRRRFSGWIGTPDGQFTSIKAVRTERGDWARVSPNDKRLVFDTETDGGVDGFDFRSDSAHFTFELRIDGEEAPGRVFIGRNERNPSRMPFVLTKWESHPRDGKGGGRGRR